MDDISKTIQALTEPAVKLIEAVQSAIGVAYEPHHHKKMTDAEVYRINEITKVIRQNGDLPIEYKGDALQIDIAGYTELASRTGNRIVFQELCKQKNIETIADKAYDILKDEEPSTEEKIEPEWINRFVNLSGEISTEEMQEIWARILAGEVLHPGEFSMKTLECLKNMSVQDAKLFEEVVPFIISDSFLFQEGELNTEYGITYNKILSLDEMGLINSGGSISYRKELRREPELIMDLVDYMLFASSEHPCEFTFHEYPLSRAGRELVPVVRKQFADKERVRMPEDYVKRVITSLIDNHSSVTLMLNKVVSREKNRIIHDRRNLIDY